MPYKDAEEKRAHDRARVRRLTAAGRVVDQPERRLREQLQADLREARKLLAETKRQLIPLQAKEEERRQVQESLGEAVRRPSAARWSLRRRAPRKGPGVPTLLLSDLHMNETVVAAQVLGVNHFSPEVARARLRECFETAVDLGTNHMVRPTYDGCCIPVAGDLLDVLQGWVHRSERQSQPFGMDAAALVADALEPGFRLMADAFGAVYSPWVTGNHGRLTVEMPFQDRTAKSLDAAVYYILEGRLRGDRRFRFELAPGPRLVYSLFAGTEGEYHYLLLHGDPPSGMPRGGDSEAGFVNIVARGVKRLRSLHLQIGLPFHTAVMGHFHSYFDSESYIVNGCLPGYGEYSSGRAFPFEKPKQAFWFTHPRWGITCSWPIHLGKHEKKE